MECHYCNKLGDIKIYYFKWIKENKGKRAQLKENDHDDDVFLLLFVMVLFFFVIMNMLILYHMRACEQLIMVLHYTLHLGRSSSQLTLIVILEC